MQAVSPVVGVVGFLNSVVANLLTPFLSPAPNTPDPFTPVVWAVLAWSGATFSMRPRPSRRPYQTGQTVTGSLPPTPRATP